MRGPEIGSDHYLLVMKKTVESSKQQQKLERKTKLEKISATS